MHFLLDILFNGLHFVCSPCMCHMFGRYSACVHVCMSVCLSVCFTSRITTPTLCEDQFKLSSFIKMVHYAYGIKY